MNYEIPNAEIRKEKDASYLVRCETAGGDWVLVWFPKSQCRYAEGRFRCTSWILERKNDDLGETLMANPVGSG